MSTLINEGGPAFPINAKDWRDIPNHPAPGMSLRAYIATKAMQALINTTTQADVAKYNGAELREATARGACAFADALIAELGKEGK